jgi:hypothetical protein
VIHDCRDYREIAYFFGAPLVEAVFIAGRPAECASNIGTSRR